MWVTHLLLSIVFYIYTRSNPADTNGYWKIAKASSYTDLLLYIERGFGTNMMYVINYLPANILDLSIFTGILIYSFIGFLGVYFIYTACIELVPYNSKFLRITLFPTLLFLPSIHFWSAGPGKDALMFFSISLFFYAMLKIRNCYFLVVLSLFISLLVRPHVLILLLAAFGTTYLMSLDIKASRRIIMFFAIGSLGVFLLPTVLTYVNLESLSIDSTIDRLDTQAQNLSGSGIGSSFDIQSYPWYLKIFTFLYRPLYFDYNGLFTLVTSTENILLLIISIKALMFRPISTFRKAPVIIKASLLFLLLGTLIFSFTLSNFGIILRMKNMFLPGMIMYLLWALSYKHQVRQARRLQQHGAIEKI